MYALHARSLLNAEGVQAKLKTLTQLKKKLAERIPVYQEFEANFLGIRYTDSFTKQKKLVQYILARIDGFHAEGLPVDYARMTIEHLDPQSRGVGIPKPKHVGQLGNLILCDKELNAKLGNKPFASKLAILKRSRVWLDETLENASSWENHEVVKRTKALAKVAYEEVWAL